MNTCRELLRQNIHLYEKFGHQFLYADNAEPAAAFSYNVNHILILLQSFDSKVLSVHYSDNYL